ncbi:h+-translocating pyrophosphatase family [Nannochloropsis gaditana]|uniref:H(+)-exporting diphosphatase n=1 Tax=Nannochloropsis gaditana TaxID=72520 RepID=W7TN19_9STRA|nr:h+-translocating pyrophosphatase family [Nannochloropsis gaditana]
MVTTSQDLWLSIFVVAFSVIGLAFAAIQFKLIADIQIISSTDGASNGEAGRAGGDSEVTKRLKDISGAISTGADAFLHAEYLICVWFSIIFACIIFAFVSWGSTRVPGNSTTDGLIQGALTTVAFLLGAFTSMLSGWIGMKVAVFANVRTTIAAQKPGWTECFNTAFRAGGVMGFALTSLAILILYIALQLYKIQYPSSSEWFMVMEAISGYGLGGSSIAMFGRVGGGIYTKAADVGADLVGKVVHGIPEDDPRNPAVIADNVGDNVGDVAGMGADLFGSFAESTCAALVIASQADEVVDGIVKADYLYNYSWSAVLFPLVISATGLIICLLSSFVATHLLPVRKEKDVENALKIQLIVTTLAVIPVVFGLAHWFLPGTFSLSGVGSTVPQGTPDKAAGAIVAGALGGLIIGLITEFYTSHSFKPVREVANACKTGAATNIIYGLALGYKSCIIPVFILAIVIFIGFYTLNMYGVALAAIGMLVTLATGLTIDAYGPVCDNAGGIAEMALQDYPEVREKTDALDAAGNTTAAIGKGFAIGSAALVSLALYGAFAVRIGIRNGVNILSPVTFAFLLIGSNLPYWFSALTMKSVGTAAMQMVMEVERQFREQPQLLNEGTTLRPDYTRCVDISTKAALKEMVPPAALVMLSPLIAGTFFGKYAVAGVLTGGLVSGVQLAVSMSNTGGAWDNAKKYIEKQSPEHELQGKGSDIHKAAVVGDTVGDPLKDTSGPSLNILMKLMAIISLVFAPYFLAINDGNGVFHQITESSVL